MRLILIFLACIAFFSSCESEPKEPWNPLNLLDHGLAITILAPDSAEVKTMDLGLIKDVTIKKNENYYIQISASQATTTDILRLKSEHLNEVKNNRYFSKIVKEEETGFIYETKIDSTHTNYGFRHIRVQGDQEYIFQTGLIGTFTLPQTERMYEAVKQ